MKGANGSVKPEEFVRIWQQSTSPADVADKLKQSVRTVCGRAANYRKHGVQLKRFRFTEKLDWTSLKEVAAKSVKK